ncbi:DUF4307 domain-containing protein [Nesterenkonia sp. MY13]|uniref:DUF4307 domain-containing protein n=1 Tax=Nesterenkonia sedimenti TaxID=1463632 RepID=A0A7X8TKN0_9MICC|nr:DUF4307 domain-containing protein [Nesterenkonia sedimenti]NLS10321.1 DUF4307 domain-containing protein [Nesterenkonia sedimenti]
MNAIESARDYDHTELAQRYGTPTKRRITPLGQKIAVIAALVIAVAVSAWFTIGLASGQLEYQDVGYTIESDTRATVEYEVTKDFDATAQCMLHVLDESYAIVGSRLVTIGPHEGGGEADRAQYYTSELRTEYRGVSGVVDSCWLLED